MFSCAIRIALLIIMQLVSSCGGLAGLVAGEGHFGGPYLILSAIRKSQKKGRPCCAANVSQVLMTARALVL